MVETKRDPMPPLNLTLLENGSQPVPDCVTISSGGASRSCDDKKIK